MDPWREVAAPRKEASEGRPFGPDEFAIALEQVVAGTAPENCRDPARFFSRTPKEHAGMRHGMDEAVRTTWNRPKERTNEKAPFGPFPGGGIKVLAAASRPRRRAATATLTVPTSATRESDASWAAIGWRVTARPTTSSASCGISSKAGRASRRCSTARISPKANGAAANGCRAETGLLWRPRRGGQASRTGRPPRGRQPVGGRRQAPRLAPELPDAGAGGRGAA